MKRRSLFGLALLPLLPAVDRAIGQLQVSARLPELAASNKWTKPQGLVLIECWGGGGGGGGGGAEYAAVVGPGRPRSGVTIAVS